MKDYFNLYRAQIRYNNSHSIPSHPITCGYCGQNIAPHIGYCLYADTINGKKDMGYVYQCPLCKNPIIFFIDTKETIPGAPYGREIKNLPDNIQTLYNECRTCYANQCYTSAQMIARTLLMHIAVEQGAEEGLPFARYVTYLDEKGYILCVPSTKDKRRKNIYLTEKAYDIQRRMEMDRRKLDRELTRGMTRREIHALRKNLEKLLYNIADP